jgi:hypothetical protein
MDALRLVGAIFGPLAAILIGAEAGAGDVAVGVFRDLVATGRSWLVLLRHAYPPRSRCPGSLPVPLTPFS